MQNQILARNNVKIIGEGEQVLLFAYGFGCDQTVWKRITPSFEQTYRIVLFDYVGSNGHLIELNTPHYIHNRAYEQLAIDIRSFLESL